ncbi:MAG: hypothetical protein GC184_13445 [Rhizobiales bacterium]|nr:hypothetical protein [Hyphomicrobiales bacterium]
MTHFAIRSLFLGGVVLGLAGHMGNLGSLAGPQGGALLRDAALHCSHVQGRCDVAGLTLGGDDSSVMGSLIASAQQATAERLAADMRAPGVVALLDNKVVPEFLVSAARHQLGGLVKAVETKWLEPVSAEAAPRMN